MSTGRSLSRSQRGTGGPGSRPLPTMVKGLNMSIARESWFSDIPVPTNPRNVIETELQFKQNTLTKSAFAAQILFVTLITTALFALFVLFFFFVIASKVEKNVVQTGVTNIVQELSTEMKVVLPPAQVDAIARTVAKAQVPADAAASDAAIIAQNNELLKKAGLGLAIFAIVIAVVVIATYFGMQKTVKRFTPGKAQPGVGYPNMKSTMVVVAAGFGAAIVTEFIFLFAIAARFQPLDANVLKHTIVKQLVAIAQGPPPST